MDVEEERSQWYFLDKYSTTRCLATGVLHGSVIGDDSSRDASSTRCRWADMQAVLP